MRDSVVANSTGARGYLRDRSLIFACGAVGLGLAVGCGDGDSRSRPEAPTSAIPAGGGGGLPFVSDAGRAGAYGGGGFGGSGGGNGIPGVGGSVDGPTPELLGPPLVFAPTASSFGISAVIQRGNAQSLSTSVREEGQTTWYAASASSQPTADVVEWTCAGLQPGTRYEYQIVALTAEGEQVVLFAGTATTKRPIGQSFSFALLTDTHISPAAAPETYYEVYAAETLPAVGRNIGASQHDFMVHLGDVLDFHRLGFVVPPTDGALTRLGYVLYRGLVGPTLGQMAHFNVIGNWDGENGYFTDQEIAYSRQARLDYIPGPTPRTYPEGGSEHEDYYAFTWGDALFVVLNVMTYTPTPHRLGHESVPGTPDDWTLGDEQLAWFQRTLEGASSRWRFVLIHHTVGGAAGDLPNSAYGRGGGQAAYVGEQALVHDLMLRHGVQIFFYGHDHVFTDMVVDGIHYTLPGSAGAPPLWMFTGSVTGYEESWAESGHAQVEVGPDAVRVEFLNVEGERLYEYLLEQ